MTAGRSAVIAMAVAVALTGCGLGPGESSPGEATLTVTRDYGAEPVLEASVSEPAASETVIRFLDREAEITTRYGGGFVQSIDGTRARSAGGRTRDWFFFVNGIESARGAAEVGVRGGDRIWWDYRDWTDALRTPAVVGSWPEPFAQRSTPEAERLEVSVQCLGEAEPCDAVAGTLDSAGVDVGESTGEQGPRVLVGPWNRVRADAVAAQIEEGPAVSGVFARFERSSAGSGYRMIALGHEGEPALTAAAEVGLVAAVRRGEEPPTWVVTGVDAAGVRQAAAALGEELSQRYSLMTLENRTTSLPLKVVDK